MTNHNVNLKDNLQSENLQKAEINTENLNTEKIEDTKDMEDISSQSTISQKAFKALMKKRVLYAIGLAVFVVFFYSCMQPMPNPTPSMHPTVPSPCICFSKVIIGSQKQVKRFDVVNANMNKTQAEETKLNPIFKLCKRVIGLGGETVEIKDGYVYINGELLDEPFLPEDIVRSGNYGPFEIPEDCVFLMGDNRNNSFDSRQLKDPYFEYKNIKSQVWATLNKDGFKLTK